MIKFKRLTRTATIPTRGTPGSAGLDLYSDHSIEIHPGQAVTINTNVAVQIPAGHVGLIWPRSGLAARHGLDVLAGVIDADYRSRIGVVLINHGVRPVTLKKGDRVAQMIIQPVAMLEPVEVESLDETVRGAGGFGSTGVA